MVKRRLTVDEINKYLTPRGIGEIYMAEKLGLVLSSGAARGWAHIGVLDALNSLGVKPDVITGCSVGALVGGAHLIGALDAFEAWARTLKPMSVIERFSFKVTSGGLVNSKNAFEAFRAFDQNIEDLPVAFGAVATDLASGNSVAITKGSILEAARASSAIPVVFNAVKLGDRWLLDGALSEPAPCRLAKTLGATKLICVDLNAAPKVLDRFEERRALPAVIEESETPPGLSGAVQKLIRDTQSSIRLQIDNVRARSMASPKLIETALAAADIFQMQLARAHCDMAEPDVVLRPDVRDALPNAFDRADEFIENGRLAVFEQKEAIMALTQAQR